MPQRENSKSDLGNTKRASDSYDVNNCFLTEQGWFYRHFKGDPTDPNVRYWDEIIIAGTADGEQAIPYSTETSEGSLLVTTPGYEDGPDTKFDVTYGSAVDHDSTINIVPPGPDPVGYAQYPPYVGQAPGGGGGNNGGGNNGGGGNPTPPSTTIGTVTVSGNQSPAENSTETYSFTISGDATGYTSGIATDVPGATAIQPNQIQFTTAGGGGNVNFIISDANSSDDGAFGSLIVTPVASGGGGGGGTGGAVDSIEITDPTGGAESPTGDYTFSASQTGSGTGTTYQWTATGDANIVGDATQSSAVVHFTWTDGNGTVTVEVTSTENGSPETLSETTNVSVEKPVPVIGQVTPTLTSSSPIIAGQPTAWLAATTLGLDSGPVESSEAEWIITDSGATIADETSTSPTITFSAAGTYDVTARVRQRNNMGWGEWVEGTASAPVAAPGSGGGTGGALDSIDIADPTSGAPTEGFQSVTFTASNTGGDTGSTYAWTVTGDGEINGPADQASVNVDLEWTGGNNNADENGVATVSVLVTASDASESINQSTAVTVLKPLPVIGTVTVTSETSPVLATVESQWKTIVSQGIDSGPTESENTVWSVSPSTGVTIVQDGTNRATITFPDTQAYEVTATLTRSNSRGDSAAVPGTATQTPGAAPVPPTPSDTYTYSVVVNGNGKYELTGESLTDAEAPTLTITETDIIVFRQGDASNANHPIRVYRNADKSGQPVVSLSQVGTAGDGGANTGSVYTAVDGAGTYYYQCENHANMGGTIIVNA